MSPTLVKILVVGQSVMTTEYELLSSWKIDPDGGKPGFSPANGSMAPLTLEYFLHSPPVSTVTVL